MVVDYVSGLIVVAVFKASKKTETGALERGACRKGIFRKIMTLVLVAVAYRLDKRNMKVTRNSEPPLK